MARYIGNEKTFYCCQCETHFAQHENKGRWEDHHVVCPCCKQGWWERDIIVRVRRGGIQPFRTNYVKIS